MSNGRALPDRPDLTRGVQVESLVDGDMLGEPMCDVWLARFRPHETENHHVED